MQPLQILGRRFITSEYVEGAKTPNFSIPRSEARRRPYYFVLFSDVLVSILSQNFTFSGLVVQMMLSNNWRPMLFFIYLMKLQLIGKRMNNVLTGKYRCYLFPLLNSKVRMANQLEDGFFPVQIICSGNVSTMGENHSSKDEGMCINNR